jgi:dinuclear metal center YbgI/SA1388 family protein
MYPIELAEEWDTIGLQVKPRNEEITGIIVGLTLTNEMIDNAVLTGNNLIICHHPMFFNDDIKNDLLNIKSNNLISKLIAKGIGFYGLHTNFDKKQMALSIASLLKLENVKVFDEETSLGIVGNLSKKKSYIDIIKEVSDLLDIEVTRYSDVELDNIIETVAICPGSGREFLDIAIEKADIYLTGDLNYHSFEKAVYFNYPMIDINHYNSEVIGMKELAISLENLLDIPIKFEMGKNFFRNYIKKN